MVLMILLSLSPAYGKQVAEGNVPINGQNFKILLFDDPALNPECRERQSNSMGAMFYLNGNIFGLGCWIPLNGEIHTLIKRVDTNETKAYVFASSVFEKSGSQDGNIQENSAPRIPAPKNLANEPEIESELINTLRLKGKQRVGGYRKAIETYSRKGLINKNPNQSIDYTDYYLVNKPLSFMGHQLLVIEEEYMQKYIGCCVSPGVGISIRVVGSTKNIEEFAHTNKCTFNNNVNLQEDLRQVEIKTNLPQGDFASLSCRERDIY